MADITDTPATPSAPTDARRLRIITPDEQREFTRLAGRLLSSGMTEAALSVELGYDSEDDLRQATKSGRATTARLERLRSLVWDRLGEKLAASASSEAKPGTRPETTSQDTDPGEATSGRGGRAARAGSTDARRSRSRKRGQRKEYLDRKGHARLVEAVDHLRAVDGRFANWSLLARVMGLSSGQAAKRAYEVNSSLATLQNVETFSRLHAGFGSRATGALKSGITIDQLQGVLTGGGTRGVEALRSPAAADESAAATGGKRRRRSRQGAGGSRSAEDAVQATVAAVQESSDLPPARNTADTTRLFEIAAAVDAELTGVWQTLRFFDGVAHTAALPGTLRDAAADARDHLRRAVECFGGEVEVAGEAEEAMESEGQALDAGD